MTNKAIGNVVANVIATPVGLCTYKVAVDLVANMLPAPVGIPVKIAYKVGTVGVGIIADQAIAKTVCAVVNTIVDASEEAEKLKETQKNVKELKQKEVGA